MQRSNWQFKYAARKLMDAAKEKKTFHEGRLKFWTDSKAKVMAEIRESGIDVQESVAGSNYSKGGVYPQVVINDALQEKLTECHSKMLEHDRMVKEYHGWVEVLNANLSESLPLNADDWVYFFGK